MDMTLVTQDDEGSTPSLANLKLKLNGEDHLYLLLMIG